MSLRRGADRWLDPLARLLDPPRYRYVRTDAKGNRTVWHGSPLSNAFGTFLAVGLPIAAATYTQWRPMVERSRAWLVRKGNRRVAYRDIERNRIWLSHRVAAVDLRRLLNLGLSRTPR